MQQWPPQSGRSASGCECRLGDNPCCYGTMAPEPMRRAAETDTAAEALEQNAWSPARAEELTGTAAAPPPTPHHTWPLLTSHGALRPEEATPSKTSPPAPRGGHVRATLKEQRRRVHCALRSESGEDCRAHRERSTPPNLSNHWHGDGEHLGTEHLRARQEKEEPRGHGSDYKVLRRRRQKEEEQGECGSGLFLFTQLLKSWT